MSHSACSILLKQNSKLSMKLLADHLGSAGSSDQHHHMNGWCSATQCYSNMERIRREVRFPVLLLHAALLPWQPAEINNVSNLGCQSIQNQTSGQITDLPCSGWKSSKKKLNFCFNFSVWLQPTQIIVNQDN